MVRERESPKVAVAIQAISDLREASRVSVKVAKRTEQTVITF